VTPIFYIMSQSLNSIHIFDGTNYCYWKVRMCLFLKFIDVWQIVETWWSPPSTAPAEWTIVQTSARLSKDKALNALC
jgi:hypothetical protein